MLLDALEEAEAAGYSLVASCFSDTGGKGGLFVLTPEGVDQIDDIHSTGLYSDETEIVRLLRCQEQTQDCTVRIYRGGAETAEYCIPALQDGHDVLRIGDTYAAVSASSNAIVFFDGGGMVSRRLAFPGDRDSWHLNSLVEADGRLYASAFGRFAEHRAWDSELRNGAGIVFDVETGADAVTGLTCPHQPRRCGSDWVICNSGDRAVVEVNNAGRISHSVPLHGWTRGLALRGEFLYVGVTPPRHGGDGATSARIDLVSRSRRSVVDSRSLGADEIYDLVFVRSRQLDLLRGRLR